MEADKENVFKTKIPVPIGKLPPLPMHLLEKKIQSKQDIIFSRIPLKTLQNQLSPKAGPSIDFRKPKSFISVNTKHVTFRNRNDRLDRNYAVFKDKFALEDCISFVSDNEIYQDKENPNYCCFEKENEFGNVLSAVTPNLKGCLEPNRVRNIKRSLKRPHSRELQGLSPKLKEEKLCDKVKRRLPFTESLQERLDSPDFLKRSYMKCLDRDYGKDIFEYLLSVESKPLDVPTTSSITRACVINWLMKVNGPDGNPSTIQTACWYLDSILSTGQIRLDKLQLTAAACYWIAQKLHGPVTSAATLVKCSNKAFTADKLLNAEKAILKKMKFTPQPVVVQDYICHLTWYCDQNHGGEIEVAATFLYMCGLMVEKVLCEEYPSVIAVAAVKNALVLMEKKHLMLRLQTCHVYKAAEKKATKLSFTCSILRRAALAVSSPKNEYKTPLEHYGTPPSYIAQRIIAAANKLSVLDPSSSKVYI